MSTEPKTLQELFSKDGSWTQGCIARDRNGQECSEDSTEAICWCLYGGTHKIYGYPMSSLIKENVRNILGISIVKWNDEKERTIEDIRNLVKELNI